MARLGARGAMLLAVVALGVLLVTPDLCQAHVRARYRADYTKRLTDLDTFFNAQALHFDNLKQGALDSVDAMTPLVNDPSKRDELLAEEEWARQVWIVLQPLPDQYKKEWDKMATSFRGRAALYFEKRSQQRDFQYFASFLRMSGELLAQQAMMHIVDSYWWLCSDPPDLAYVTGKALPGADEDAATAHEGFDQEYGKLRAMR